MSTMNIQEYIRTHKLITDGAFGTYYADRFQTQDMPELANISFPQRVTAIHQEYIEAGARLLRTNTFASNTILLHADMNEVRANITAAVNLAKEAVKGREDVFIAGDIGPIPSDEVISREELEEQYYQIARVMLEQGLKILTFETFHELQYILPAIGGIKTEAPDTFIMVEFTVNQFGYSSAGLGVKSLLRDASACKDIDAVGLNCGIGPAHMEKLLDQAGVGISGTKYRIALPNAGYPRRTSSRIRYSNSSAYFAAKVEEMAAQCELDIVGGCCGTTPEFIRQLSEGLDMTPCPPRTAAETSKTEQVVPQRKGFLYDEQGNLKAEYTIEGMHIKEQGYRAIFDSFIKYALED